MTLTLLDLAIVGAITIGALLVVATTFRKEPVVAPSPDPSSKDPIRVGVPSSIKDEIDQYVLESIERFTRPKDPSPPKGAKPPEADLPGSQKATDYLFDEAAIPSHYIPAYEIGKEPRYHFDRGDVRVLLRNKNFYGITPQYLVRTGTYIAFRRETFDEWYEKLGKKLHPKKDEKKRKQIKEKGK